MQGFWSKGLPTQVMIYLLYEMSLELVISKILESDQDGNFTGGYAAALVAFAPIDLLLRRDPTNSGSWPQGSEGQDAPAAVLVVSLYLGYREEWKKAGGES